MNEPFGTAAHCLRSTHGVFRPSPNSVARGAVVAGASAAKIVL